jgi:benzoate membrane transport protein
VKPAPAAAARPGLLQPVLAGVVAAVVGFASTFAVVLAGLRAVGASAEQASSGLLAVCLLLGVGTVALAWRNRLPVTLAWSTPGAALLVSVGTVGGGYPAALGAFAVCGALLVLTGLVGPLSRALARIPIPIASAMLAGVLLPLCLAPVRAVVALPAQAGPVVATWALLTVVARRWAVPGALVVAVGVVVVSEPLRAGATGVLPHVTADLPSLTPAAIVGLALPLWVVTMASQNLPGLGVLRAMGYDPAPRGLLVATGGLTIAGAPFGGHVTNLAAITAALTAGPDADPDPARRWIASVGAGAAYLVLGLGAGLATALVASSPPLLIEAVAGLALLGALGGALTTAMTAEPTREAAVVTFVVSASSISALGLSPPFWGLVAGLALLGLQRSRLIPRGGTKVERDVAEG